MELNEENNLEIKRRLINELKQEIEDYEGKKIPKKERISKIKTRFGITMAVIFFVIGLVPVIHGMREVLDPYLPMSLNEFGDYLGGTVASLWSIAGVLIIYTSFVAQQLELVYTRLEQFRGRLQLLYVQYEVLLQQNLNESQLKAKMGDDFRFHFETLITSVLKEIHSITILDSYNDKVIGINAINELRRRFYLGYHKFAAEGKFQPHKNKVLPPVTRSFDNAIREIHDRIKEDPGFDYQPFIDLLKSNFSKEFLAVVLFIYKYDNPNGEREFILTTNLFDGLIGTDLLPGGDVEKFLSDSNNNDGNSIQPTKD